MFDWKHQQIVLLENGDWDNLSDNVAGDTTEKSYITYRNFNNDNVCIGMLKENIDSMNYI